MCISRSVRVLVTVGVGLCPVLEALVPGQQRGCRALSEGLLACKSSGCPLAPEHVPITAVGCAVEHESPVRGNLGRG